MNCRDCIHHDVCKDFIDTAFDGFLDDGDEVIYDDNDMRGDDCEFYQDRSRFVELPADGIMYGIIDGRVTELLNLILQPGDSGMSVLSPDNINKTIFSTKEQAEQALKEREGIE